MDLKEAFATLEIEDGSSFDKARAAYRRLCIVWHPDRFQDGELKAHAEDKLKRINEAFATIKNAAATEGSTVETVSEPVHEDLSCRYRGGDVRLWELGTLEFKGRQCAVQIAPDSLLLVTFRDGHVDQFATYSPETFARLSGPVNHGGFDRKVDWILPADASRFFKNPPSNFPPDAVEIRVGDPEGIIQNSMLIKLTFRSNYYAQLFAKRMREAWGLVKPEPKPKPDPKPKPEGGLGSDTPNDNLIGSFVLAAVVIFIIVMVLANV